jgi:hypothetical protein
MLFFSISVEIMGQAQWRSTDSSPCTNIDDFAEKVKQKRNTNCQVALFFSLQKDALRPGLTINELLKTDYSKKNSGESDDYSSPVIIIHQAHS